MSKQRGFLFLAILVLIAAALLWGRSRKDSTNEISAMAEKSSFRGSSPPGSPGSMTSPYGAVSRADSGSPAMASLPATPEELASLQKMTAVLAAAANPKTKESDLLRILREGKQEPFVVDDSNPITGAMDIIRTKSPFPGTRYFHAQYFGEGKKEKFMQHISFEFKPGPQALQQAIAAAQAAFHVGKPQQTRDNFYEWILKDGYCAWVSPLEEKDMEGHPFNAYSAEDKGSIRVVVEICNQEGA